MTKEEVLKMALEALYALAAMNHTTQQMKSNAITAIKEALAQPEKPKYRRGNRLICLETEEYCVIHISGTDRQWVKFPDSHVGVYTNEQVAELFELLPKEPEQEPVAFICEFYADEGHPFVSFEPVTHGTNTPLYTAPQRTWVGLTAEEKHEIRYSHMTSAEFIEFIEAKLKETNT